MMSSELPAAGPGYIKPLLLIAALVTACSDSTDPLLGGVQDAGPIDSDAQDAGGSDVGAPDRGVALCEGNQRVASNRCVDCSAGEVSPAGADPRGPDTFCDALRCGPDERVQGNMCIACPSGSTNAPGDLATGADTMCEPISCEENERVFMNACRPCPPGTENMPGDDASGSDTTCDAVFCDWDERVASNQCVPCEMGLRNEPGDDASGDDTECFDACTQALDLPCSDFDEAYIKSSNGDPFDAFGSKLDLSGDTLVVAAYQEDGPGRGINPSDRSNGVDESGAVYVFERSQRSWREAAYLKASNSDADDLFGQSVAVDGDWIAVGAPLEDSGATGVNGSQTSSAAAGSGAVYLFERAPTGWTQQAYIKASNTEAGDWFGWSVDLSGDTLVVSAVREDSSARGINGDPTLNDAPLSGAVYVFVRSQGQWRQQAYIKASNADPGDEFGWSISIADDTLVVGSKDEAGQSPGVNGDSNLNGMAGSGAAYIFERNQDTWRQTAYLKSPNPRPDDFFGWSVATSTDTAVVGAPLVDQPLNSGAAYVYTRQGTSWRQQAVLKPTSPQGGQLTGDSVDLFGRMIVVGANGDRSQATGINGNPFDSGATLSGAAFLFERVSGQWVQNAYIKASNTDGGDQFGTAVALTGTTLAIGADGEQSSARGINEDQSNNDSQFSGAVYIRRLVPTR